MGQTSSRQQQQQQQQRPPPLSPDRLQHSRRTNILRPSSAIFGAREAPRPSPRPQSFGHYSSGPPRPPTPPRQSQPESPTERSAPPQRSPSRLRRARTSLTANIPDIFRPRNAPTRSVTVQHPREALAQPGRPPTPDAPAHPPRLPQMALPASDLDLDSFSYNRYGDARNDSRPATSADSRRPNYYRPMSSIADRISSLTPDRGFRQMIRRRRSPARPADPDNTAMLTRMLSVAAAATAASLVGSDSEEAFQDIANTAGIEGDDGTFARFLHTLRSGRLNALLGQEGNASLPDRRSIDDDNHSAPNGLQFFRVFRFGNHANQINNARRRGSRNSSRPTSRETAPVSGDARQDEAPADGRMIPVLMIGIRSLQSEDEQGDQAGDAMPSFLDALANFPPVDTQQLLNNAALRQSRNGVNFSQRRRASMGGFGLFSGSGGEGQRRLQRNPETPRPLSEIEPTTSTSSTPGGPGSYPPPTTPSSPPLSALSSGASTPSRRASISSVAPRTSPSSHRDSHLRTARTALESTAEEPPNPRPPRARRLSESDFMRYGSGSARRNGVVEPDHVPTGTDRESNRSWIIYVLGGNYPENHPILLTPSLFTDSPSYEDMLLLSSLLGPAKPPVASAEEVSAAGGLFQTKVGDHGLQLVGGDPLERFPLAEGEKCLVCLCDFSVREVVRRLNKCKHLFHQECIDQWLTTGRNACPLCRQQGVDEAAASSAEESEEDTLPSSAVAAA
ncbi:hypothetical protein FH972_023776 [Carpinus fangiana]|uniref:RING-type domain-containing protein n=1 Tax=Carpinus fangiana TaxID=176857 RepID=A0A5N6KWJ2_9ROSI|nr:hypothetical protein FH972_023776 [Carpinus fangiana]